MALPLSNNASGGTNGAGVTSGNSGGASGNPWDLADNAITFDSAQSAGATANSYAVSTSSSTVRVLTWSSSQVPHHTRSYGRAYARFSSLATDFQFVEMRGQELPNPSVNLFFRIGLQTGYVRVYNSSNSAVMTASAPLSTNTWYRFEWDISKGGSATGYLNIYLGHSTTPLHALSYTGNWNSMDFHEAHFGVVVAAASVPTFWLDDLALSSTGPIGPSASPGPIAATAADTLTAGDSPARAVTDTRAPADTVTAADTPSQAATSTRAADDTLAVADSPARQASTARAAGNLLALGDSVATVLTLAGPAVVWPGTPHHSTLVADVVRTFNFSQDFTQVEITNVDGAGGVPVYFRFDGVDPQVDGPQTHVLPGRIGATVVRKPRTSGPTQLKMISAGTPKVSIRGI